MIDQRKRFPRDPYTRRNAMNRIPWGNANLREILIALETGADRGIGVASRQCGILGRQLIGKGVRKRQKMGTSLDRVLQQDDRGHSVVGPWEFMAPMGHAKPQDTTRIRGVEVWIIIHDDGDTSARAEVGPRDQHIRVVHKGGGKFPVSRRVRTMLGCRRPHLPLNFCSNGWMTGLGAKM